MSQVTRECEMWDFGVSEDNKNCILLGIYDLIKSVIDVIFISFWS